MHEIDFLRTVSDDVDVCPYLPDQLSRLPLCIATTEITPDRLDALLAAGYRRCGWYYYRTRCPRCSACEPLRLAVGDFRPGRSQTRARKLGDKHLRVEWALPSIDARRLQLFNKHRQQRKLGDSGQLTTSADYQSFLVNATCLVAELQLWCGQELVGVSITDVGATSLSAVYCYFDPDYSWLSLGTFAILTQIDHARRPAEYSPIAGKKWLYLGLYVAQNQHLNYKGKFRPHQRLVQGEWRDFERD